MSSSIAPAERIGLTTAVRQTVILARRNLLHIKSDAEQLVGMTAQPLMFLVLFVYVFGGAIAGSSADYLRFALPGILVQGIAFTSFQTALGLNIDSSAGSSTAFALFRSRDQRWSGGGSWQMQCASSGAC